MIVLHIDDQTGWRGGEQQASYLIEGLLWRGCTSIIAGKPHGAFLKADHGGAVHARVPIPCRGEVDPWSVFALARAVRRFGADVLHAHSSHALTYAVLARRIAGRARVVASRRVDFPPARHALNRWKYAQPDRVIAISEHIARVLREFGLSDEKLRVVYSGVDPARLDVAPIARQSLGVPEGAPLIGNVAALVAHKDHRTLIDAMPRVLREFDHAHLLIAGDGPLRGLLEAQIARLGIGDRVKLLGYRRDVPNLLRALDLFVISSCEEGLGTSVLDAMVCRVPVVATAAGGIPEMVKPGETGWLVPSRDPEALASAIIDALTDRDGAAARARRAEAVVRERFSVDQMVEGNLRVYEELLAPP